MDKIMICIFYIYDSYFCRLESLVSQVINGLVADMGDFCEYCIKLFQRLLAIKE